MAATIRAVNKSNGAQLCGDVVLLPGVPVDVPLDFYMRFGGQPSLQFDWSSLPEYLSSRTASGALQLDWHSPLSGVDGYGRHAIFLIRALQKLGVSVKLRDGGGWAIDYQYLPADITQLRRSFDGEPPSKVGVSFTLGYDPALTEHAALVKVGITQFETNRLPKRHVENVNKLDHVIVTSSFQVDVFRKSGVEVPISVMTPGIETDYFQPHERRMDGKFKVLMVGALTQRKDPIGAIRIFQQASRGNPDWRFTIKSRATNEVAAVRNAVKGDPRITVIVRDDPPDAIRDMYHTHDCLLWPSKGEGVGLPPLEAMATGMELVCADNSGMRDYLDKDHAWPIKSAGMESAVGPNLFTHEYVAAYGDVGQWWVPDLDHGARQLERCFNAWREGKGKGARAAEYVRQNHSSLHSARDIIQVVERYA
jgi:glycosyltransferase involved in cell wall biosynthesis